MLLGKPLMLMVLGLMSMLSVRGGTPNNSNSEVFCQKQHVSILDGKLVTTDSVEMIVYNAYGNREISVPYDQSCKLKVFKAWMEDMDGKKVYELPKKAFEDRSQYQESAMFADCRERACRTDYSVYPHRFVYTSTTVSDAFLHVAYWFPTSYKSLPLRRAELWVHRPLTYAVRTKSEGIYNVVSDTMAQVVTTHYVLTPSVLMDETSANSNIVQTPPFVWVVPERIFYGVEGFHSSWGAFGQWVEQLNRGLTTLPEQEKMKVRSLLAETEDTLERVRILYHYLQDHTRYVNIQLGIGGMKSYPASYVSVNKFGDCKALSNYMKALLEEAGIGSHFVLVNRDVFPKPIYSDFPTSQFNHMMLLVPLGKDTLWLENTSSINVMGQVDITTQNRPALLLDSANSRLIRTPSFGMETVRGSRKVDIRFDAQNEAEITINHRVRGWENNRLRLVDDQISSASKLLYVDPFIPFKHYDMKHFEIKTSARDEQFALLNASLRTADFLLRTPKATYLPQVQVFKGLNGFSKPDDRTRSFPFPVCQEDTVLYWLPPNLQWESLPAPIAITCPYGSFLSTLVPTEHGLMAVKTFRIEEGTYAPEAYRVLYEFVQKIADVEKKSLLLHTHEETRIALP